MHRRKSSNYCEGMHDVGVGHTIPVIGRNTGLGVYRLCVWRPCLPTLQLLIGFIECNAEVIVRNIARNWTFESERLLQEYESIVKFPLPVSPMRALSLTITIIARKVDVPNLAKQFAPVAWVRTGGRDKQSYCTWPQVPDHFFDAIFPLFATAVPWVWSHLHRCSYH